MQQAGGYHEQTMQMEQTKRYAPGVELGLSNSVGCVSRSIHLMGDSFS